MRDRRACTRASTAPRPPSTGDGMAPMTSQPAATMPAAARSVAASTSSGSDGAVARRSSNIGLTRPIRSASGAIVIRSSCADRGSQCEVRDVDGHHLDRIGDEAGVEGGDVGGLEVDDARILAQRSEQLTEPRVDRVHARGARLEQDPSEATGRRAEVEADPPGHAHVEPGRARRAAWPRREVARGSARVSGALRGRTRLTRDAARSPRRPDGR